jgi:hypothetical protein
MVRKKPGSRPPGPHVSLIDRIEINLLNANICEINNFLSKTKVNYPCMRFLRLKSLIIAFGFCLCY